MIDKTYNNSFEKQLEEADYKWFEDRWKNSIRGFQKKFTDDKGVKYFITGYHYNIAKQLDRPDLDKDSYSFNVQFTLDKNEKHQTINIEFMTNLFPNEWREFTTLKDIEQFYEKCWLDMKADYYELYN